MRYYLLRTTLITGLLTCLTATAQPDLNECLAQNKGKADSVSYCLEQVHKAMADQRRQELQQKYTQSLTELNKQSEQAKEGTPYQPPPPPSPGSTATNQTTEPSTSQSTEQNVPSTPSTPTVSTPAPTPQKKSIDVRPEPRGKPKGVQWY